MEKYLVRLTTTSDCTFNINLLSQNKGEAERDVMKMLHVESFVKSVNNVYFRSSTVKSFHVFKISELEE
jgi:hypothetical protein